MSDFEKKKVELELQAFTARNFERPADCKDPEQIRFYIRELCLKIEEYKSRFQFVPEAAFALLAQYTARQNSLLLRDFVKDY